MAENETDAGASSPMGPEAAADEGGAGLKPASRRSAKVVVLALALVLIASAVILGIRSCDRRSGGATLGSYDGKSLEEIQAELDQRVKDSMMTISLDVTPELSSDGSKLELRVQNVRDNKFDQKVVVEQHGREIGSYTGLKPGEKLDEIDVEGAEEGTASVTITALESDSGSEHGNPSAFEVTIHKAD